MRLSLCILSASVWMHCLELISCGCEPFCPRFPPLLARLPKIRHQLPCQWNRRVSTVRRYDLHVVTHCFIVNQVASRRLCKLCSLQYLAKNIVSLSCALRFCYDQPVRTFVTTRCCFQELISGMTYSKAPEFVRMVRAVFVCGCVKRWRRSCARVSVRLL